MACWGYALGLVINGITGYVYWNHGYDPVYLMIYYAAYQFGRLGPALGHVAVVALIVKAGALPGLVRRLASVGQMALSSYVGTSIVCSLIFNGYGLGLYGAMRRWQLYLIVIVVWVAQLIISPIWLRYFQFGPLEWLWRSLTYLQWEPIRVQGAKTSHPVRGVPES
jgi:uncharacterized protein